MNSRTLFASKSICAALVLVFFGVLLAVPASAMLVSGKVVWDQNGDGIAGKEDPGLAQVVVSDGEKLVLTSKSGQYQIETEADRIVFVSIPRGYRAAVTFYGTAAEGRNLDFALSKWPESQKGNFRFVHITDLHVANEEGVKTFIEDLQEISCVTPKAAFVLATGDLVNIGKHGSQYEDYLRALPWSTIPIFNVPGNHDANNPESMANYHHYLGPDHYSFNAGNCHFVVINCMKFDADQKAWIEKDLALAPKGAAPIFAMHFLPSQADVDYLVRQGGRAVLSGHWHGDRVAKTDGLLDLNTPPLRFGGIDRHPRSFRVIDVDGTRITSDMRYGGFKHHAVVVSPAGICEPESGKLPVLVNAGDTRCEVVKVDGQSGGQHISLERSGFWSWTGKLKLTSKSSGPQKADFQVRAYNGEVWTTESEFEVHSHDHSQGHSHSHESSEPPLRFVWGAPAGGVIGISSPVAGQGTIAIGTDHRGDLKNCGITCFRKDGKRLWQYQTDSAVKNSIAFGDGRFYATSIAGWLYAVDQKTGKLKWKAELDRKRERWEIAATGFADGVVYVGGQSYIAAFNAQSGERIWENRHGENDWWPSCYVRPIIVQDKLVLPTRIGLYALDRKTGRDIWKLGARSNGAVVQDNAVYSVRGEGFLTAVCLDDGKILWESQEKVGDTASAPALCEDKLVMGTADGRVCAFSTTNGSLLWTFKTGPSLSSLQPYKRGESDVNSSPAIKDGTVYVGASDGELYAISLKTGEKLGSHRLGLPIASSPLFMDGFVYVGCYDGNLYAFATPK